MTYAKTDWQNRVVEKPLTYTQIQNSDGSTTLIPAPGTIVQEGTPVNAANLNKMDYKLYDIDKGLEPQVTTGTADAFIADVPESTALITIIPHIDNEGNTTLNGLPIYDGEGLSVNSRDLKKDVPVQLIIRPNCFFVASSGSTKGPELLKKDSPAYVRHYPDNPYDGRQCGTAYLNGHLYVFGAYTGGFRSKARRLNVRTGAWEDLADLPIEYTDAFVKAYKDKIYIVGSSAVGSTNVYAKSLVIFDPIEQTYTLGPSMQSALKGHGDILDSILYFVTSYYVFSINLDNPTAWTQSTSNLYDMTSTRVAAYNGVLYCFGSLNSNNQIYLYRVTTGTWTLLPSTISPSGFTRHAVTVGDFIYYFGFNTPITQSLVPVRFDPRTYEQLKLPAVGIIADGGSCTTDGFRVYFCGSQVDPHQKRAASYRPPAELWRLPGGVQLSPYSIPCGTDNFSEDIIIDKEGDCIRIAGPQHVLMLADQYYTMQKGATLLKANTRKPIPSASILGKLPQQVQDGAACKVGDEVYIFGNHLGDGLTKSIKTLKYNIPKGTLTVLSDSPVALNRTCALYHPGGQIHLFGASFTEKLHLIYDIESNTYSVGTPLPQNTYGSAGVRYNSRMTIFGGGFNAYLHLHYDATTDTYTQGDNSVYCDRTIQRLFDEWNEVTYVPSYRSGGSLCFYIGVKRTMYPDSMRSDTNNAFACGCVCDGVVYFFSPDGYPNSYHKKSIAPYESTVTVVNNFVPLSHGLSMGVVKAKNTRIYGFGGNPTNGYDNLIEMRMAPEEIYVNGTLLYNGHLLEGHGWINIDLYKEEGRD